MKKSWVYGSAIVCSAIFGFLYFTLFAYVSQDASVLASSNDPESAEVVLYLNQLGIYKNAANMMTQASVLTQQGVDVLAYNKNDVTIFVTHLSFKEQDAKDGITKLKELGYNAITKRYTISDQDMLEQLKKGEYEQVLAKLE